MASRPSSLARRCSACRKRTVLMIRRPEDIDYAESLFGFLRTSKEIEDERARPGQLAATSTQHTQVTPVSQK